MSRERLRQSAFNIFATSKNSCVSHENATKRLNATFSAFVAYVMFMLSLLWKF